MATKAEVKDAIYTFFRGALLTAYPMDTPETAYPNTTFTIPVKQRWLSIVAGFAGAGQESIGEVGSRKFIRSGLINVAVSTPLLAGTLESDTLSENIANIFEGNQITLPDACVIFRNARTVDIGPNGEFYLASVNVDFEFRVQK